MRILIHDFAGAPFPVQLSRDLAAQGHEVIHAYCGSLQTPQASMARRADDAAGLRFEGLCLPQKLLKTSLVKRWKQERTYASLLLKLVAAERPDAVVSSNTPTQIQGRLVRQCRRRGIRIVTWVQDLWGLAAYELLRKRLPLVGGAIGKHFMRIDRRCLRDSDGVVLITEGFRTVTRTWGIDDAATTVIPNWAPLDELPQRPRRNPWSARHGLDDKLTFLYSGTLAMKHNPDLLLQVAVRFKDDPGVRVVVISEGPGIQWLAEQSQRLGLTNLLLLPFQPFAELPDALGSADVLVSILENSAGQYSVPSKTLTYLCANRPLLLAVPSFNLAARTVAGAEAGLVSPPDDVAAFVANAERLAADAEMRRSLGRNGRRYAERTFDITRISEQFAGLLGIAPASPITEQRRLAA